MALIVNSGYGIEASSVCHLPHFLSALGLMSVDVTRKKMSSRNTMSVIDDIENPESTFVVLLIAISLNP